MVIFFSILIICSCQSNSNPTDKHNDQLISTPSIKVDSNANFNSDINIQDSIIPKEVNSEAKKKTGNSACIEVKKEPVIDNNFQNVMDDPNYVGTPCLIVDGKCIRHNHGDSEIEF